MVETGHAKRVEKDYASARAGNVLLKAVWRHGCVHHHRSRFVKQPGRQAARSVSHDDPVGRIRRIRSDASLSQSGGIRKARMIAEVAQDGRGFPGYGVERTQTLEPQHRSCSLRPEAAADNPSVMSRLLARFAHIGQDFLKRQTRGEAKVKQLAASTLENVVVHVDYAGHHQMPFQVDHLIRPRRDIMPTDGNDATILEQDCLRKRHRRIHGDNLAATNPDSPIFVHAKSFVDLLSTPFIILQPTLM